jgi:hypothetical protein
MQYRLFIPVAKILWLRKLGCEKKYQLERVFQSSLFSPLKLDTCLMVALLHMHEIDGHILLTSDRGNIFDQERLGCVSF